MLRHTLLLLFLCGIKFGSGRPQTDAAEARENIRKDGIKKSEVGAKGSNAGEGLLQNFRNPVLEYLLNKDGRDAGRKGIIREIHHGLSFVVPPPESPLPAPPPGRAVRDPEKDSITNFYEYVNRVGVPAVTSPVLHLNKSQTAGEWTKTEAFPAAAILVSTYDADGKLKSSVTHFRPLAAPARMPGGSGGNLPPQRVYWPLAGYFPIVVNDPFVAAYNGITSSMYNTFSSVIEYGPEADICREKNVKNEARDGSEFDEVTLDAEIKFVKTTTEEAPGKLPETSDRKKRDTSGLIAKLNIIDRERVREPDPRSLPIMPGRSDLVLRRGGIAIAGPGGAATAYTGGTAIVGPYGTVYKAPAGTAIMGPFSRVVNITDDMSFDDILRLHTGQKMSPDAPARKFRTYKTYFSYLTDLPDNFDRKEEIRISQGGKVVKFPVADLVRNQKDATVEVTAHAKGLTKDESKWNETLLVFRPKARAEAGRNGVAISAPVSHAIVLPNQRARIKFEPESVASAGPGGFAHAHSDLFLKYLRRR